MIQKTIRFYDERVLDRFNAILGGKKGQNDLFVKLIELGMDKLEGDETRESGGLELDKDYWATLRRVVGAAIEDAGFVAQKKESASEEIPEELINLVDALENWG